MTVTETRPPIDDAPTGDRIVAPRFIQWLISGPQPQSQVIVRRLMMNSQTKSRTLILANLSTTMLTIIAATMTGAIWAYVWVAVEITLGVMRVMVALDMVKVQASDRPVTGRPLYLGLTWAVTYSIGCALCVISGQWPLIIFAAIVIAGLAGAISSRNAGMPRYGLTVICILALPYTLSMIFSPLPQMYLVGLLIPAWGAGMTILQFENYNILLNLFLSEEENKRLADYDQLTGLPNRTKQRRSFDALLSAASPPSRRAREYVTVLCLDLDGFKAANDSFGHATGDAVLVAVADRLRNCVRDPELVFRVGGDEFVVLLPGASAADATCVAERIIASVSEPLDLGVGRSLTIGVSVGAATFPDDSMTSDALLRSADHAMYAAKRRGKGVLVHWCSMQQVIPLAPSDATPDRVPA